MGDTTAIDAETAARLFLQICEQNESFGNRGDMTHEQFLKECDCELFSPEQIRYADQSAWTSVLKVNGAEGSTIVEL